MPYQSRDDLKKKLESPRGRNHNLVAMLDEPKKVVGMVGLHPFEGRRAHVAGLGMFVHDDHQNQGIGGHLMQAALDLADNWLNLRRLELTVHTDNKHAVHLYDKFGFVKEGTFVDYAIRDGEFIDAHTMARVRKDCSVME
ncbi:MAG: putative acetyltransferase [Planctomycetota bacterium]|jgi:putative acetyltransferase